MKKWSLIAGLLALVWLATGFFIVRGNERALVRRFGKVLRQPGGQPQLFPAGLFWQLPWPCSRIDRLSLQEIQTLTVGTFETTDVDPANFLQVLDPSTETQYLTGDKNILQVQVSVQYRIAPETADLALLATTDPKDSLRLLTQSTVASLFAECGVDFVHPAGQAELQRQITLRLQQAVDHNQLGLLIDSATLSGVAPPVRVRADFLDVSNARADRETTILTARAFLEQKLAAARSQAQTLTDQAEVYRQQRIESSRGEALRFQKILDELAASPDPETARKLAIRRMYLSTLKDSLSRVSAKLVLGGGKQIDLTIVKPALPQ